MVYPNHSKYEDENTKCYRSNFRDFYYELKIHREKGYQLELSMSKGISYSDQVQSREILDKIDYCKRWQQHLVRNKIIPNSEGFNFFRAFERGQTEYVAIYKDKELAFMCTHLPNLSGCVGKKIEILKISEYDFIGPHNKRSKRKDDINQWELFKGWESLYNLLGCYAVDLERITRISSFKTVSESQRNALNCFCRKNGISIVGHKDHRGTGIRIANKAFFNFQAAEHYAKSIVLERFQYVEPSYDVLLDKKKGSERWC